MKKYLGIDIGGSKLLIGVLDEKGKVLASARKDYAAPYNKIALINDIKTLTTSLPKVDFSAAGVNVPGLADSERGIWLNAPYIPIKDWECGKELSDILGIPVFVENDVNACALAERRFGLAKDTNNFMWITLSNGVGGALFLNGNLYRGQRFGAGEIGHIAVEENGLICCCGNRGCLETVASGRALSQFYFGRTGRQVTAKQLQTLAENGDLVARDAFNRLGAGLGKAISYAANLLNIDTFYIGGGVAEAHGLFSQTACAEAEKHILCTAEKKIEILHTGNGYNAALIGCAAVAAQRSDD